MVTEFIITEGYAQMWTVTYDQIKPVPKLCENANNLIWLSWIQFCIRKRKWDPNPLPNKPGFLAFKKAFAPSYVCFYLLPYCQDPDQDRHWFDSLGPDQFWDKKLESGFALKPIRIRITTLKKYLFSCLILYRTLYRGTFCSWYFHWARFRSGIWSTAQKRRY